MADTVISLETEAGWFRGVSLFIALFGTVVFFINAARWNAIRESPCNAVSTSEVNCLYHMNLVLGLIFLGLTIWAFIRLFFRREYRIKKKEALKASVKRQLTRTDIGYGGGELKFQSPVVYHQPVVTAPASVVAAPAVASEPTSKKTTVEVGHEKAE